jgi:hypothetical protein
MTSSTRHAAWRVGSRSSRPAGEVISWTAGSETYCAIALTMKSWARGIAAMFIAAVQSCRYETLIDRGSCATSRQLSRSWKS